MSLGIKVVSNLFVGTQDVDCGKVLEYTGDAKRTFLFLCGGICYINTKNQEALCTFLSKAVDKYSKVFYIPNISEYRRNSNSYNVNCILESTCRNTGAILLNNCRCDVEYTDEFGCVRTIRVIGAPLWSHTTTQSTAHGPSADFVRAELRDCERHGYRAILALGSSVNYIFGSVRSRAEACCKRCADIASMMRPDFLYCIVHNNSCSNKIFANGFVLLSNAYDCFDSNQQHHIVFDSR